MTDTNIRWNNLVLKYGSEENAKAEMRRRGNKAKRNLGGKGGFASMSPEKLSEIASKGGKRSKRSANIS